MTIVNFYLKRAFSGQENAAAEITIF